VYDHVINRVFKLTCSFVNQRHQLVWRFSCLCYEANVRSHHKINWKRNDFWALWDWSVWLY